MQQANFGTCYVVAWAYSLEQQNAGRAYTELCHASGFINVAASAGFVHIMREETTYIKYKF